MLGESLISGLLHYRTQVLSEGSAFYSQGRIGKICLFQPTHVCPSFQERNKTQPEQVSIFLEIFMKFFYLMGPLFSPVICVFRNVKESDDILLTCKRGFLEKNISKEMNRYHI